jgi:hypothetical protein
MENDSTKKTLCEGYRLEGQIKTAMGGTQYIVQTTIYM